MSRIVVVGGAGAMGRITVRDLAGTADRAIEIVVADRNLWEARRATRGLGRRVRLVETDVTRPATLASAVRGASVIVNACHHSLNLQVMDAALGAGSHYCDLGGLFHMTRRQLARDREFRRAGLLAICGIGSAPGIVNVMARAAADRFERVDDIHIAVGTRDMTPRRGVSLLATSYSIQTVLDEASLPAALFTGGRLTFVEPLSGAEPVRFPRPVGVQHPARTLHSELATLPRSFRDKGIREVSFRIAFPDGLADRLRFVNALGLTSTDPISVNGRTIAPRDALLALLAKAPRPLVDGPRDEYEILRVVVRGQSGRRRVEDVMDCHVPGAASRTAGVDIDTGAPPSIVAQMLAGGAIRGAGVLPPERIVPARPFFAELRRRGMRIVRRRRAHARGH